MAVDKGLLARIQGVVRSASLRVFPVGKSDEVGRGILQARDLGRLHDVVKLTFGAAVLAAAMAMPNVSHAQGVGYDANVYGQQQGQVMQAGSATKMVVESVRLVKIEVAAPAQKSGSGMGYAITGAAAAGGAIIGSNIGGNNQSVKALGAILGGLAGGVLGNLANDKFNAPEEAKQVVGTEIVLLNPANNQISVVTQAGDQQFAEGDRVLVTSVGGNTRVVMDRSQVVQQQGQGRSGAGQAGLVADVVRSASMMGLQVDKSKVAEMLEKGGPDNGIFTGKVIAVDRDNGFVYQSAGRGAGVVLSLASLTRVPEPGEDMTVRYKGGQGVVEAQHHGHAKAHVR